MSHYASNIPVWVKGISSLNTLQILQKVFLFHKLSTIDRLLLIITPKQENEKEIISKGFILILESFKPNDDTNDDDDGIYKSTERRVHSLHAQR